MRAIVLALLTFLSFSFSVSAMTVETGKGTRNAIIVEGMAYAIPIGRICGMASVRAGNARYDVGREGKYVTIGGQATRIVCRGRSGGGGGQTAANSSTATPTERVTEVYGPGVTYTNDTHTSTAGSGGQQGAGDEVPSRTVTQSEFGGDDAPATGGGGGNTSTSGETSNGREAPGFE